MKKQFTLWRAPAEDTESAVLLGEFTKKKDAVLAAQTHIPADAVLTDCWNSDGDSTTLGIGKHGTLLIVEQPR